MCKWCGTRYCRECLMGDFPGLMKEPAKCRICNQVSEMKELAKCRICNQVIEMKELAKCRICNQVSEKYKK